MVGRPTHLPLLGPKWAPGGRFLKMGFLAKNGQNRRAAELNMVLEVLVQVNTAGTSSQSGVAAERLIPLMEQLPSFANLRTRGLMTIAENTADEVRLRDCFRTLRELAESVDAAGFDGIEMRHLSMGMSNDFELAVAEGATMLRVGTAIFGPRD